MKPQDECARLLSCDVSGLGLLDFVRTDTSVSAYQNICTSVRENSLKIVNSDTHQEIPDTCHFLLIEYVLLSDLLMILPM